MDTATQVVKVLEERQVKYVFGIPGEENIHLIDEINRSKKIKFILVRHEQGASFMADVYGRLTGKPGIAAATLGPGAINLLLGVADAQTNSTPLIAITAQGGLNRIYKESHQVIDLKTMFKPVTKWSDTIYSAQATPEIVNKAFNQAIDGNGRPGATYIGIPEDVEVQDVGKQLKERITPKVASLPRKEDIYRAAQLIRKAKHPIGLVGMGVIRENASTKVNSLIKQIHLPSATTFMGKGAIDDHNEFSLGVVGFMEHDYENFAFDQADLILSVGYELSEFDPEKINPQATKKIIHINTFSEDTDQHYPVDVNIVADITASIDSLKKELGDHKVASAKPQIKEAIQKELDTGKDEGKAPLLPQQVVTATREAVDKQGIVLVDTGALKMWMARLYQAYNPNSILIDNGLSTMSWTLPGSIGAKLAEPKKNILAVMGDGAFMMNSQELETAVRYHIPITVLIWVDKSYGLIKWKMDMEMNHHSEVNFNNPNFLKYTESFGAHAHLVNSRNDLVNSLRNALGNKGVNVIVCPVDYRENMKLIKKLGQVTFSL